MSLQYSTHPSFDIIANNILRIFKDRGRNTIVGISGRGGAGKTTLVEQINSYLVKAGINVCIFHVDDFVFPIAIRDANPHRGKARYFESYDFETLFQKLLAPLKQHPSFQGDIPVLNRKLDRQEMRAIAIEGPSVILIEGVQLFRQQHANVFDYKIWLEISFEEGLKRALSRKNHLGVSFTEEEKAEQYIKWSTAGYTLHDEIDRPKEQADVIVSYIKNS